MQGIKSAMSSFGSVPAKLCPMHQASEIFVTRRSREGNRSTSGRQRPHGGRGVSGWHFLSVGFTDLPVTAGLQKGRGGDLGGKEANDNAPSRAATGRTNSKETFNWGPCQFRGRGIVRSPAPYRIQELRAIENHHRPPRSLGCDNACFCEMEVPMMRCLAP